MTLGQAIRFIRTRQELTLRAFGKSIGLSHVAVYKAESDVNGITRGTIAKIKEVYGIDAYILSNLDVVDIALHEKLWREYYESIME